MGVHQPDDSSDSRDHLRVFEMRPYRPYMQRCEKLGEEAKAKGNPAVGAVLVSDGKVVAEGMEATADGDVTRHAEIEAIRRAVAAYGKDLSKYTLVTTHEPCAMCSFVIRYHRISKVVYKQASKFLGGINSSFRILTTDEVPPHWGEARQIVEYKY